MRRLRVSQLRFRATLKLSVGLPFRHPTPATVDAVPVTVARLRGRLALRMRRIIDYAAGAMKGQEDIESYLLKIGLPFEPIAPGMWNIKAEHENLVVSIAGPVVVFRTKVMDLPAPTARRCTRRCCG